MIEPFAVVLGSMLGTFLGIWISHWIVMRLRD